MLLIRRQSRPSQLEIATPSLPAFDRTFGRRSPRILNYDASIWRFDARLDINNLVSPPASRMSTSRSL